MSIAHKKGVCVCTCSVDQNQVYRSTIQGNDIKIGYSYFPVLRNNNDLFFCESCIERKKIFA